MKCDVDTMAGSAGEGGRSARARAGNTPTHPHRPPDIPHGTTPNATNAERAHLFSTESREKRNVHDRVYADCLGIYWYPYRPIPTEYQWQRKGHHVCVTNRGEPAARLGERRLTWEKFATSDIGYQSVLSAN
ncbi:hypothetical protein K0M31_020286 [Melipona bicolor]|uniref:Uncharacterized protein n=1 Tax=Melipona bicolor TaxID=60889 RepID=A0AA40G150_9HYME|nr:hypothetical protein K0M31_020286 [Melipona bicolor]